MHETNAMAGAGETQCLLEREVDSVGLTEGTLACLNGKQHHFDWFSSWTTRLLTHTQHLAEAGVNPARTQEASAAMNCWFSVIVLLTEQHLATRACSESDLSRHQLFHREYHRWTSLHALPPLLAPSPGGSSLRVPKEELP